MTALIILAAGGSDRLGEPKQSLIFQNKTLLERAIETGLASGCIPVIVVLGAKSDLIYPSIQHQKLEIINNASWSEGIASSIRIGITAIEKRNAIDDVVIMLCDQPFVTAELIRNLQQKQAETGKPIVACKYQDTVGVPALFDRSLFNDLLTLTGNEGAKKIIKKHEDSVATIAFELGGIDIDTKEDYEHLIKPGN